MGIMNCYDNDRIADSMIRLFAMLKNNASAQGSTSGRGRKESKEYIDTNYTSPDLSLSSIAEKFQISEGYVTRLMKKEYDMKVSQYVNEKRIERVKYLMKDDSLNINDIAEQAGFYSYRTMIRSFKQSEGVTPTEYRKKKDEKRNDGDFQMSFLFLFLCRNVISPGKAGKWHFSCPGWKMELSSRRKLC